MELCQHIPAARNTEELTRSEDIQDMDTSDLKYNSQSPISSCDPEAKRTGPLDEDTCDPIVIDFPLSSAT